MKALFWKSISMRAAAAVVAGGAALGGASTSAVACDDTSAIYLGSICMMSIGYCPRGFAEAAGGVLPIAQNSALYALLSTTYGGDGRTVFQLPDLRGRFPVGMGQGVALSNVAWGETRGAETGLVTKAIMPAHTHDASTTVVPTVAPLVVKASQGLATKEDPEQDDEVGVVGHNLYYDGANPTEVALAGVTVAPDGAGQVQVINAATGGGQPVPIVDPSESIRFCVATVGVFPTRD